MVFVSLLLSGLRSRKDLKKRRLEEYGQKTPRLARGV